MNRQSLAATVPAARGRVVAALVPAGLALVTFVAFSAALDNEFVDWDDTILFTNNQNYRGLGWTQLRWMMTTILMGHYVPVTWLTHGLDYVLWGMDARGYHLVNVVFHAANAVLFYFIALRLLRAATSFAAPALTVAGAASALFFAVHPLRAESVAWVTERRDVVSGFFLFLTLVFYLRARDVKGAACVRRHAIASVCYLLAILSKSMVMTLPVVLILLDLYPFRRMSVRPRSWLRMELWREKVPYIALGMFAAMVGYWAQAANRFITTLEQVPSSARPAMVAYSLWFYATKTVLPLDLAPLYELPARIDPLTPQFLAPALGVVAAAVLLALLARHFPAPIVAAAAYAATLLPVIGIVHSGYQLTHDRYSYLTCLSIALLIGALCGAVYQATERGVIRRVLGQALAAALVGWFAALAFLTSTQVASWHDTETLWRHAVDSNPGCSVCQQNLGVALLNRDQLVPALTHLEEAYDRRPDRVRIRQNIGLALARLDRIEASVPHFKSVLEKYPDEVPVLMNLGVSLMKLRRHQEGIRQLRRAALLSPNDAFVLFNLGTAMVDTGRRDEAIGVLRRATDVDPNASRARYALFRALAESGEFDGARRELGFLRVLDRRLADVAGPLALETW